MLYHYFKFHLINYKKNNKKIKIDCFGWFLGKLNVF